MSRATSSTSKSPCANKQPLRRRDEILEDGARDIRVFRILTLVFSPETELRRARVVVESFYVDEGEESGQYQNNEQEF